MSWEKIKLKEILKQHNDKINIDDSKEYKQVTVSNTGEIRLRGIKKGLQIGTKRQIIAKKGWFIYSRLGVHEGSFGIVPEQLEEAIVTGDMPMFEINKNKVVPDFLLYSLKLPHFKRQFIDLTRGLAQSRIREKFLLNLDIDLPSLKEQEIIISKLNKTKISKEKLDNINSQNESLISSLSQSILQEAVQGKLVPQDTKDEPASELLKKIKAEKEKLIKEGRIKKEKPLPPISKDEIPYELPKGWEWVRLNQMCNSISAGGDKPDDFVEEKTRDKNIPVIANGETNQGIIGYTKEAKIFDKSITVSGRGTIGYSCIRDFPYNPIVRLIVLIPNKNIEIKFLKYTLSARLETGLGTSIPQLTVPMIETKLIPLPPLYEQRRIVEKVDKLMAYCDELEKQVKENKENTKKLMEAVLRESFEKI